MDNEKNSENNTTKETNEISEEVTVNEDTVDEKVSDYVAEKMEKSKEYKKSELDEELERLTEAFREELKKQRGNDDFDAEFELIQQLEAENEAENPIAEEDLCHCCGAQKRNYNRGEDYQYCEDCRNAMKKYPFSIHHFIIFAAVLAVSVLSVISFANEFGGYKDVFTAKKYEKENKYVSAVASYQSAVSQFTGKSSGKDLNCKSLYLKIAEDIYKTMPSGMSSMDDVADYIEKGISSFKAKLPIYSGYLEAYYDCKAMEATYEKITELAQSEKYSTFTLDDLTLYDDMMADMEALLSETVSVSSFTNSKEIKELPVSEIIVRYFQYMLAYSCEKSEDSYKYLSAVKEADESAVWLYGYDLGTMEIQNGNVNKSLEYVKSMKANNIEDSYAYILEAFAYRMKGNYEKSLKICEKGLDIAGEAPDLYRQKAMTLILQGEFEEAEEACKEGIELQEYGALYYVYLIAATEAKDTEAIESINSSLEELGVETTEKMQKYIDGKITYKDVLLKGTGDIE